MQDTAPAYVLLGLSSPVLQPKPAASGLGEMGHLVVRHQHEVVFNSLSGDPQVVLLDAQLDRADRVDELLRPKSTPLPRRCIPLEEQSAEFSVGSCGRRTDVEHVRQLLSNELHITLLDGQRLARRDPMAILDFPKRDGGNEEGRALGKGSDAALDVFMLTQAYPPRTSTRACWRPGDIRARRATLRTLRPRRPAPPKGWRERPSALPPRVCRRSNGGRLAICTAPEERKVQSRVGSTQ